MPDMRRLVHQGKSDLFIQLPRKGFQGRLGCLDTSTGSGPDDDALGWQVEPAQQHAIHVVHDDRSHAVSEVGIDHDSRLPKLGTSTHAVCG